MKPVRTFYKFTLEEDFELEIPPCFSVPDFHNEWVHIESNHMTITQKYSWDGCSPKKEIFKRWIVGTWDGPINPKTGKEWCYYASLVHDALCQFKIGSRFVADRIFRHLLEGFIFKEAYYLAVRTYGLITT